ncbi:hypothetical protein BOX15_Mlig006058g2 [Macrostomum lignano]|uniref:Uncharacterized protein n=1 Tax=Macrostomum lignano TaxID=282301 RepID=A0A267DFE9_9PLAT|nr:hypothetical protein BOX15_Mlig006058g2 [Macrostomum lignano]
MVMTAFHYRGLEKQQQDIHTAHLPIFDRCSSCFTSCLCPDDTLSSSSTESSLSDRARQATLELGESRGSVARVAEACQPLFAVGGGTKPLRATP